MKQNGKEVKKNPKKGKTNTQMKAAVRPASKKCANVMKPNITNRNKKDLKRLNLESATTDTIAETIAFVIKGQLTPIKPLTSVKTSTYIKRLQKERCCKINAKTTGKSRRDCLKNVTEKPKPVSSVRPSLPKNVKPKSSKSTAKPITVPTKSNKIVEQPKQFSKHKDKKDTDKSVKKIIRKYAKKLTINDDKPSDISHKNGDKQTSISRIKYKENKDNKSEDLNEKKTENISNFAKVVEQRRRFRKPSVTIIGSNSIVKPRKKCARLKYGNRAVNNPTQSSENTHATTQISQELETKLTNAKSDEEVKIKEEKKVEEVHLPCIKTEPVTLSEMEKPSEGENITYIKKEPILENQKQDKVPILRSESDDQVSKKKSKSKKLKLLKKKGDLNKARQKQLEDKRRAKLWQFWNSPKRHRVASLNAIAKVHCLYENESKAVFDKIAENSIIKKEPTLADAAKKQERKANTTMSRRISYSSDESEEEQPVKRILRDVPGLRAVGKHWDMHDSISSDNNSDFEMYTIPRRPVKIKKEVAPKKTEKPKKADSEKQKRKRKPKEEVYMDLKDMVVKKRMASLNASAILAASYSSDKKTKPSKFTDSSSYDTDSSAEEYFAAIEEIDLTKDTKEDKKQEDDRSVIEVHTTPNKKVAVILNQDTDVTITGVYVNSTTRSTHHEGYCSIAGMQYRISATSHTQTAATAVSTETLLQSSGSSDNAHSDAQSCSSKSYTPLDALSSMQPPPGPGIHNAPSSHPGMPCQPIPQMASPQHRQHPPPSTFSPPQHGPSNYAQPPAGKGGPTPPVDSPGYIHGYYQPAGPLISVSHGHGQLPTQQPPLPKSVPLSDASPTSVSSSVHQPQPPPAPGSNNGDSSDNEVIITSVTTGNKDQPSSTSHQPSATYRYPQYSQYHTYPCPPQYHYQIPPPPTPPYQHHEMCYPTAQPSGYVRHTKYAPSPSATYQRYPYYSGHGSELYPSTTAPPAQPSQQIATASQISSNGSYPPALTDPPPPPTIIETYPPPPGPPTLVEAYQGAPHYYQSAYGLPPTCYSHTSTRAIPYINATYQHCPCPLNTCPKNGHTGPLTGESKRSNISKDSKPLPPVALALPLEPVSATGPPSPARGSAGMPSGGMPPPPSPAGAHYQPPAVPATKPESRSPEALECKVEKRKARVGKANVRNNMHNTMLLMCNPTQDYVKREIESPKDKEELHKQIEPQSKSTDIVNEKPIVPEACTTTTCSKENCDLPVSEATKDLEIIAESVPVQTVEMTCDKSVELTPITEPEKNPPKECSVLPPVEEPLPPCIATVAENVKVKNMKRKQSQSNEKVPESIPPPTKKKKLSSYKDFIRKHTSCFKINNGKKKLVSKTSRSQMARNKFESSTKKKLGISKEQTNNRRITSTTNRTPVHSPKKHKKAFSKKKNTNKKSDSIKSAPKILDNLIAKNNIDRVIEEVIHRINKDGQPKEADVKKSIPKASKQLKISNMKTTGNRRKSTSKSKNEIPQAELKLLKKPSTLPKWSNGWKWEGESYECKVFINSDETTLVRRCYPSMRHKEGDLIRPGDCVLLKAGPRRNDLPYVAKIAALWENPEDGEMMMSLLWYYRPEHTEQGRLLTDQPDEVFASRHKDSNSVACVDDKCYVLTFNEYCRCKKNLKRVEEGLEERPRYVPLPDPYPRIRKQPPTSNISPEMIFFCRKVYDFRQKRLIKNPT